MHKFWSERLALSDLVVETLIGPIWVRLLLTGEPITHELFPESSTEADEP